MSNRKGCGCLLACTFIVAIATILGVGALYWFIWSTANSLDPEAKPLPVPEMSEELEREVAFTERTVKRMSDEGAEGCLELSAEILNAWLRLSGRSPIRFIGEHSWVSLDGTTIRADVALPLSPIGVSDRFFNGKLTLEGEVKSQKVRLIVTDVIPEGQATSMGWISLLLKGTDLSEPFGLGDLLGNDVLERCEISVRDSKLHVACKSREAQAR
jgi:hypothetical protein